MKAIMLRHNALTIRCESKFEEAFLAPIITALEKGENKEFSLFASSDEQTGLGFMTIEIDIPKKEELCGRG